MNNKVLVNLNPVGYKIELHEIDGILDKSNKYYDVHRLNIEHFFKIEAGFLTRKLLSNYANACTNMTNISIASIDNDIRSKLINTLSSAKKCFSFEEYLACIELCALHGEMIANFLCIINKEVLSDENVLSRLNKETKKSVSKHLQKDNFYDGLNQTHRIEWLYAGSIITCDEKKLLSDAHNIRIKYFHHWDQSISECETDALKALSDISKITASHLELFDSRENIEKVKKYISSIEAN